MARKSERIAAVGLSAVAFVPLHQVARRQARRPAATARGGEMVLTYIPT
jgi:hypothetical protein